MVWLALAATGPMGALPAGAVARLGDGYLVAGFPYGGFLWSVSSIAVEKWDVSTGELLSEAPLPLIPRLARFSPESGVLVLSSEEGDILVFALPEMEPLASFTVGTRIAGLAVSPDGALVAAGSEAGELVLLDVTQGEVLARLPLPLSEVSTLLFSPDGTKIACGSGFGETLLVYTLADLGHPKRFPWNERGVRCAAFSPDSAFIAVGAGDGRVRIWDVGKRRLLRTVEAAGPVTALAFVDARTLMAVDMAGDATKWDIPSGILLGSFPLGNGAQQVDIFPPGFLVHYTLSGPIVLRDPASGERKAVVGETRYKGRFTAAAFSPDGEFLAVATSEGRVVFWRFPEREEAFALDAHRGAINAIAFSPDGKLLLTGGNEGRARLWALDRGGSEKILEIAAHPRPISDVDFSPDGELLLTASVDETVRIWDAGTGKLVRTFWRPVKSEALRPLIRDAIYAARFSPDGEMIAAGAEDRTVRLWELETGRLRLLRKHRGVVTAVAFSPGGRFLASADEDGMVLLWDPKRRRLLKVLRGSGAGVFCLRFSPDGAYLVTGGAGGKIGVYAVPSGDLLAELRAHLGDVFGAAFHPRGELFATASGDGTVFIWDLRGILKRGGS